MLTTLSVYRPDRDVERQQVDLPQEPSLDALKAVVRPLLDDALMEHVAVLYQDRPTDMFVDEIGAIKRLPRNEAATAIYRANWLKQHPRTDPESLDAIYGPAVLFHRIVWS